MELKAHRVIEDKLYCIKMRASLYIVISTIK